VEHNRQPKAGVALACRTLHGVPQFVADPSRVRTCLRPMNTSSLRVALLYPGDREARDRSDASASRFAALFEAFAAAGIRAEPAVWSDDFADEVEAQLLRVQAVLVWCNPIEGGRRRDRLDAVLRGAAAHGTFVSAHPEAVLRLGTKDVLFETRDLPFGSDVARVDSLTQLKADLPRRLESGPRVLKQYRGHSGIGVWRVEATAAGRLHVRHAQRGSTTADMDMHELVQTLAPYFEAEAGGHMIDQAWQPRLSEGMVRAYLVGDRVAGFGHQAVNALHPDETQPGPRLYHGPDLVQFQGLRQRLESEWVGVLRERVGLAKEHLPLLWDCDFMLGEPSKSHPERYVLCEINVSSVSPFPPSCIAPLVDAMQGRLQSRH
jgi:hypothetical protein